MELVIAVQIKKTQINPNNPLKHVNLQFRVFYTIGSWQHFQTNDLLIYPDML